MLSDAALEISDALNHHLNTSPPPAALVETINTWLTNLPGTDLEYKMMCVLASTKLAVSTADMSPREGIDDETAKATTRDTLLALAYLHRAVERIR